MISTRPWKGSTLRSSAAVCCDAHKQPGLLQASSRANKPSRRSRHLQTSRSLDRKLSARRSDLARSSRPTPLCQFTPCNAGAIHRGHRILHKFTGEVKNISLNAALFLPGPTWSHLSSIDSARKRRDAIARTYDELWFGPRRHH